MKWYKINPSTSPSFTKVLYDPKSLLGSRLSTKIERGNKRTEQVVFKLLTCTHLSDWYVRGYNKCESNTDESQHKAMDVLIGRSNYKSIDEEVPNDDITQKLKMEEDYKKLSKNQFWIKYGL